MHEEANEKRIIIIDDSNSEAAKVLTDAGYTVEVVASSEVALTTNIVDHNQMKKALQESEEQFRTVFSSMNEGFALHEIICNETGNPVDYRFLEINEAFERLTGLSKADVLGKRMREVLPDNDAYWTEIYGKVALTGESIRFENYSSPLCKWYEVYAFCPAQGKFAVMFTDITERKKNEEELQRQKNLLTAVASNTEAHLVYLDRDFNFIWVNRAYAKAGERDQEEFVGRNHFELYPHEENQAIFERVRDTGMPFEIGEKPFVFPDHPERGITYWDWTLVPIKDNDGIVQSMVFSLMDVTHDVIARNEIEQLRVEAERRAAELESAVSSLTDGIMLFDTDYNILLANNAIRELMGVPNDVLNEDLNNGYELYSIDGKSISKVKWPLQKALRGEETKDIRFKRLHRGVSPLLR